MLFTYLSIAALVLLLCLMATQLSPPNQQSSYVGQKKATSSDIIFDENMQTTTSQ